MILFCCSLTAFSIFLENYKSNWKKQAFKDVEKNSGLKVVFLSETAAATNEKNLRCNLQLDLLGALLIFQFVNDHLSSFTKRWSGIVVTFHSIDITIFYHFFFIFYFFNNSFTHRFFFSPFFTFTNYISRYFFKTT